MKLLAVYEDAHRAGGIETYVSATLPALQNAGVEVRTATRSELRWADEHEPGSDAAAHALERAAHHFSPDVIALHNVMDAAVIRAARLAAPRAIYHVHDHRVFCPNGDRVYPQGGGRCSEKLGTACMVHSLIHGCAYGPRAKTAALVRLRKQTRDEVAACAASIVFSRFMHDVACRNGVAADALRVLNPPLPLPVTASAAPRPLHDTILFAARMEHSKGLASLIRALSHIPAGRRPLLHAAGDGPARVEAQHLAQRLGVAAHFAGILDRTSMTAAIDAATIVAVPSLWDEPFGLIGIEAFARGRPVAAYAAGAIPEWIGNAGIAVRPADTNALAGAIISLLQAPRWQESSAAALQRANDYDLDRHVQSLIGCYRA